MSEQRDNGIENGGDGISGVRPGGFETLAIHAGQAADPTTGAVVPPIHQVSTYKQDGVGGLRGGYEYSRSANPTRTALEENLAALEGGRRGLAFASGLAAEDCLLRTLLTPGDHVVIPNDAYGGTFRLFARVAERWGVQWSVADSSDPAAVRAALRERTKAVWVETPSNPLLGITDIEAVAEVAHGAGARLVVDNTFASPYLQQPLALGADAVVHSTTKYMGGHSDVVGGALVVSDPALGDELAFHQNAMGAIAGPFDSWLVMRGIKTLAVRMDRHGANAARVAQLLQAHPRVSEVFYPGLPSHPGHEIAAKQMRGFGGMVSFRVADGEEAAVRVCDRARLFTLGESLGGVESLIEHPGRMTHASAAGSALEVPADLVRLSVGIESADDLLADLTQALD
ncbi:MULTISPECIES: cystathionine gamma-synthase [unclassified Streptomyces]|uniref:cystathionine gamma-synthase n=1 Tax=unclassified Streptomyces TaxID=2593676 RepID=UPI002DD7A4F6|nr:MULTISPECIES: cystathionine gamma-synthase [unclassified Streptomyces]WSB77071.1 cystathionine gamma-synthase [Streptomyces sp. NBC_01775]WSS14662.1 cystathionine gamma-synthase [Streptomyces sp. NBC_01186]WSS43476.1 cystathionine gamma-synthase [Streptomyces sp. NBC_01187]